VGLCGGAAHIIHLAGGEAVGAVVAGAVVAVVAAVGVRREPHTVAGSCIDWLLLGAGVGIGGKIREIIESQVSHGVRWV
jgi:hypothetical protein